MDSTDFCCTKCRQPLPRSAFAQDNRVARGHRTICRACTSAHQKTHRSTNGTRVRAIEATSRKAHRQRRRDGQRTRYKANASKLIAKRIAARKHNPDRDRSYHRKRYEKNREAISAQTKAWAARNPDKRHAFGARRRALERQAPRNDLTAAQWKQIKDAYGNCCAYCGRKMQRLTQDHITPLSQGGSHTLHNVVPACQSCNSRKHTGPPLSPVQPLLL